MYPRAKKFSAASTATQESVKDTRRVRREAKSNKKLEIAAGASLRRERNRILTSKNKNASNATIPQVPPNNSDLSLTTAAETTTQSTVSVSHQGAPKRRLYLHNPECHYATPLLGSVSHETATVRTTNSRCEGHSNYINKEYADVSGSEAFSVPLHPEFDPNNYSKLLSNKIKHLNFLFSEYLVSDNNPMISSTNHMSRTSAVTAMTAKCKLDVYPSVLCERFRFGCNCKTVSCATTSRSKYTRVVFHLMSCLIQCAL